MALSKASLKSRLISEIETLVKPYYIDINDDHRLSNYSFDDYMDRWAQAVSNAVIDEITANAKATGTDSHGDTHNLSIS